MISWQELNIAFVLVALKDCGNCKLVHSRDFYPPVVQLLQGKPPPKCCVINCMASSNGVVEKEAQRDQVIS